MGSNPLAFCCVEFLSTILRICGCLIVLCYNNLDDKASVSIVPRLCEKFLGDGQTDSSVGEIGQVPGQQRKDNIAT